MHRSAALVLALTACLACSGGPAPMGSSASATTTSTTDDAASSTLPVSSSSGDAGASSSTTTATASTTASTASTASTTERETGCASLCDDPDRACDLWSQDCPEGEKCTAWAKGGGAWNATKCVPIDPDPEAPGEPCSAEGDGARGVDTCAKGSICVNIDPVTHEGYCVAFCAGVESECVADPASCCAPGFFCSITGCSACALCLQRCDPIAQDCARPGEYCYAVDGGFQCLPDVSGDMGAAGDPCDFVNACDPGTVCGSVDALPGCDPDAAGCCVPLCSLDAPECPPETGCQAWYDPGDAPRGYESLGACMIP
ncbi:MAG: hypothetical protein R3B09_19255 [Nannocystaceae bacterium]